MPLLIVITQQLLQKSFNNEKIGQDFGQILVESLEAMGPNFIQIS